MKPEWLPQSVSYRGVTFTFVSYSPNQMVGQESLILYSSTHNLNVQVRGSRFTIEYALYDLREALGAAFRQLGV